MREGEQTMFSRLKNQELYVGDERLEHAIAGDIVDLVVTI